MIAGCRGQHAPAWAMIDSTRVGLMAGSPALLRAAARCRASIARFDELRCRHTRRIPVCERRTHSPAPKPRHEHRRSDSVQPQTPLSNPAARRLPRGTSIKLADRRQLHLRAVCPGDHFPSAKRRAPRRHRACGPYVRPCAERDLADGTKSGTPAHLHMLVSQARNAGTDRSYPTKHRRLGSSRGPPLQACRIARTGRSERSESS